MRELKIQFVVDGRDVTRGYTVEEFHQSLQPVDVEVDRYCMYLEGCNAHGHEIVSEIDNKDGVWVKWEDVKPHLQQAAPESDAVDPAEFAKWVEELPVTKRISVWNEDGSAQGIFKKTYSQLLTEYKQSKTNSDDKN